MIATKTLWIDYTNHKGVRAWREIEPIGIAYRKSEWHGETWLLAAFDVEKDLRRDFDMTCIHAMSLVKP